MSIWGKWLGDSDIPTHSGTPDKLENYPNLCQPLNLQN